MLKMFESCYERLRIELTECEQRLEKAKAKYSDKHDFIGYLQGQVYAYKKALYILEPYLSLDIEQHAMEIFDTYYEALDQLRENTINFRKNVKGENFRGFHAGSLKAMEKSYNLLSNIDYAPIVLEPPEEEEGEFTYGKTKWNHKRFI